MSSSGGSSMYDVRGVLKVAVTEKQFLWERLHYQPSTPYQSSLISEGLRRTAAEFVGNEKPVKVFEQAATH